MAEAAPIDAAPGAGAVEAQSQAPPTELLTLDSA
jgi:hypothetical protein